MFICGRVDGYRISDCSVKFDVEKTSLLGFKVHFCFDELTHVRYKLFFQVTF